MEDRLDHEGRWREVVRFFPLEIREILVRIPTEIHRDITEVRARIHQPLEILFLNRNSWVGRYGALEQDAKKAEKIGGQTLKKMVNALTTGSFYALEEEIAQGYLTLPGGHRVGFAGQVICQRGKIKLLRNISSLNLRIARSCQGIADPLLPYLWQEGRFLKTVIFSPPACGKTTLLREIVRVVSMGSPNLGIPGLRVGLVDERSEIAGCYQGVPQLDVGPRTDVLDGSPKTEGVYLLLRAMNPELIVTDEVGTEADFRMLEDIVNAGVSFMTTAHALNLREAENRPGLNRILTSKMVERLIFLSNRLGVGTVESVTDVTTGFELWDKISIHSKEEWA